MLKFIFICFFILFVISFLFRLIARFLFGNPMPTNRRSSQQKKTASRQPPVKKKVIPESEGEYVDYVEVKD